jgi:hypothetical protein
MLMMRLASAVLAVCLTFSSCDLGAEPAASHSQNASSNSSGQSENQSKAQLAPKSQRAPVDPNKFAVVVAGVGGEEAYTKKFTALAAELYAALTTRLGFDEKRVAVLTETGGGPENGSQDNFAKATAGEVRKSFDSIKSNAQAESLVLIVLIGHGSFDNQNAKFNLVGPDLTAKDYASLIGSLPTRRVVFVNCSSSSGEFVKPLSGESRVIITATRSGNERQPTRTRTTAYLCSKHSTTRRSRPPIGTNRKTASQQSTRSSMTMATALVTKRLRKATARFQRLCS